MKLYTATEETPILTNENEEMYGLSDEGFVDLNFQSLDLDLTTSLDQEDHSDAPMSLREKLTVMSVCLANFSIGTFGSLLGPLFPIQAAEKGVTSGIIGLIFGVYELVNIVLTLGYGSYISTIGAKFMFTAGIFTCGYCSILFGLLDLCPPGTPFIVLAFSVRLVEGLGAGALMIGSHVMVATTFPSRMATMVSILEMFLALGLMVGPLIGGFLFELGGFKLPFILTGIVMVMVSLMTYFILPNFEGENKKSWGFIPLLSSPMVILGCFLIFAAASSIGFIDMGLAPVLSKTFNLSATLTGLVFLITPTVSALSSPLWIMAVDKKPSNTLWLISGVFTFGGLSYWMLGPAPFIPFPSHNLWMVIFGQFAMGLCLGTMVSVFRIFIEAARERFMPDDNGTFGMISGLFTIFFSLGASVGSMAGGLIIDNSNFSWAATSIGTLVALAGAVAFITALYTYWKDRTRSSVEEPHSLLDSPHSSSLNIDVY